MHVCRTYSYLTKCMWIIVRLEICSGSHGDVGPRVKSWDWQGDEGQMIALQYEIEGEGGRRGIGERCHAGHRRFASGEWAADCGG